MSLTVNSYDSNSINTLFSSLSANRRTNTSFTGLESVISDYTSLKGGSDGKLLKAYYAKVDNAKENTSKVSDSTKKEVSDIKSDSEALNDSTAALLDKSSKSVWNKVQTKNEDGSITESFDKDKIF